MTAAELARFRALLQEQAAPPVGREAALAARMRGRLTVVAGEATAPLPQARSRGAASARLTLVDATAPDLAPTHPSSAAPVPAPARPATGFSSAVLVGVTAGWSRGRPPAARRRVLGRLEAVLRAEREGLDARRRAEAPAG